MRIKYENQNYSINSKSLIINKVILSFNALAMFEIIRACVGAFLVIGKVPQIPYLSKFPLIRMNTRTKSIMPDLLAALGEKMCQGTFFVLYYSGNFT
ncbi:MAG: hypothetical protein K0R92_748 [Lachnospiraceae bacterium]|jgi:hypothetical protein|nr:hypothetical protein [Lachnospiraceae bacterium]